MPSTVLNSITTFNNLDNTVRQTHILYSFYGWRNGDTDKPWQSLHITQLASGRAGLNPAIDARAHTPKNYANNSHLRDNKNRYSKCSTLEWTLCLNLQCKVISAEKERPKYASFPKGTNENIGCFMPTHSGRSPYVTAATKVNNERYPSHGRKSIIFPLNPALGWGSCFILATIFWELHWSMWEIKKLPARPMGFSKSVALRNR